MKVLIVDDNLENRILLESIINSIGYKTILAANGKEALEKLRSNKFDLIISDILMPEMDGFQLLKTVKNDNKLKDILFVFQTATYTSKKDEELGLKLGVDEYIIKPINPKDFIKIIKRLIKNKNLTELKSKKKIIEEEVILKLYNEQLVKKLEEKVVELANEINLRKRVDEKLIIRENYLSALNSAKEILLLNESESTFQAFIDVFGSVSKASRTYVFMNHKDRDGNVFMSQKAEYCEADINPQIDNVELQNLNYNDTLGSRWYDILSKGELIYGKINDFPEEEREFLAKQDIKTILIIPIISKNQFLGFIGFDNCDFERKWEKAELDFLKVAANDLAIYIERKKSDELLKENSIRFQTVMDAIDAAVYVSDIQTHELLFINKYISSLFMEDSTGKKCYKALQNKDTKCEFCNNHLLIDKNGKPNEPYVWEFKNTKTGRWYQCIDQAIKWIDGRIVRIEIAFDITERKESEKIVLKASRMQATAILAGGMAHEFNNLMVGVLGNAELLEMQFKDEIFISSKLNTIIKSAKKAGSLSQQLLAFARGGKYNPQIINLNDIVQETISLNKRILPKGVQLIKEIEPELMNIKGDYAQIGQVLTNLCINSIEAINKKGKIIIKTQNINVNKDFVKSDSSLKPGNYVYISVEDNGIGMDKDVLSKVFEPFFSTKFTGRGLGLSAIYGIIKNHAGNIIIKSEVGVGTICKIFLPAIELKKNIIENKEKNDKVNQKGSETILIIDDEPMVVDITKEILENFGYRTLTAINGKEAIDISREFDGDIHLAILDMGMPIMDGSETFKLLKELRPEIKIIICSGYELDYAAQLLLDKGANTFIQKPFRLKNFVEEVRRVLDMN